MSDRNTGGPGGGRRALVVCYSRTGNTARVAQALAEHLDADVEVLHDALRTAGWSGYARALFAALRQQPGRIDTPRFDPADYDVTIIGTPVWWWRMTPAVRAYLALQRQQFRATAFFVTSGDTDIAKLLPSLERLAGRQAVASVGFSARELADRATYDRKLLAFEETVRSRCLRHNSAA